ncbi:Slp family lipoprotein [Variovorax sp. UC122_21]|uniref:Slp family lipoprotein n=1 Tax=Variovorax sp. UC122_21 TaxID=3374554 RepID=UPI0037581FAE
MPDHLKRHATFLLCAAALVSACSTPADHEPDPPARTTKPQTTTLPPAQALTPQAQGKRIHWSGGINAITPEEGSRQCFTLLHATFDAQGVLQWPRNEQEFIACGAGYYDGNLVAQYTLVSFDGRVAGQRMILGKPVPVIEIEALYRHSDCTQGNEKIPECYSGLLQPRKP